MFKTLLMPVLGGWKFEFSWFHLNYFWISLPFCDTRCHAQLISAETFKFSKLNSNKVASRKSFWLKANALCAALLNLGEFPFIPIQNVDDGREPNADDGERARVGTSEHHATKVDAGGGDEKEGYAAIREIIRQKGIEKMSDCG